MKSFGVVVALSVSLLTACGSDDTTSPGGNEPATPSGVTARCGNARITVSWTPVTGATSYDVHRSTTAGGARTIVGTTAGDSLVDATGSVGTTYFYAVTAENSSGESVQSSEVSETVCRVMGGAMQGKTLLMTSANANVSTFAGSSGNSGFVNGVGSAARFSLPQGITTDGNHLYVADFLNNVIRRIDPVTRAVTLFAGSTTGLTGSADGIGSVARFNRPHDITNDGTHLFVTDHDNCTIRKIVIATAAVTTLAGTLGNCNGPVDGTGGAAVFSSPQGITTDGINLYVTENTAVRRVVIGTGAVSTFAGSTAVVVGHVDATGTAARFNNLEGITTDGTSLFVLDQFYNDIRKIVISTAAVTTYAGNMSAVPAGSVDGTGTAAKFNKPFGIASDGTNLFVVEQYGDVVRKINIASSVVSTLAGTARTDGNPGIVGTTDGIGAAARFSAPQGITVHCGGLYIGDTGNGSIRRIL